MLLKLFSQNKVCCITIKINLEKWQLKVNAMNKMTLVIMSKNDLFLC